jgi:hypothetical protein
MTEIMNLFIYCTSIFCSIFLVLISIAYPSLEIYIGTVYKDEIVCESPIFVSIGNWLIIKGCVYIVTLGLVGLFLYSNSKSVCNAMINNIMFIVNIFSIAWLIIGSILFFRDCNTLTPTIVQNIMYISLIFGYISIFGTCCHNCHHSRIQTLPK